MKVGQYMNIISDQAHAKRREHFINILTMVKNPTAIPEHTGMIEAIREELLNAATQSDILEAIQEFKDTHVEDGIF